MRPVEHLSARLDGKRLSVELGGTAKPPDGFNLCWPRAGRPTRVVVDGKPWDDFDATACRLPVGVRDVIATW